MEDKTIEEKLEYLERRIFDPKINYAELHTELNNFKKDLQGYLPKSNTTYKAVIYLINIVKKRENVQSPYATPKEKTNMVEKPKIVKQSKPQPPQPLPKVKSPVNFSTKFPSRHSLRKDVVNELKQLFEKKKQKQNKI